MNKCKRLVFCKECNKKRFCVREIINSKFRYTCSKNHVWVDNSKIGQIIAIEIEQLRPKLLSLFERDDAFFRVLKK
jgi:hypothetical protein